MTLTQQIKSENKNECLNHIHILKTNIVNKKQMGFVIRFFNMRYNLTEVSIDIEDIDKVARIVTDEFTTEQLIGIINKLGFKCVELKE